MFRLPTSSRTVCHPSRWRVVRQRLPRRTNASDAAPPPAAPPSGGGGDGGSLGGFIFKLIGLTTVGTGGVVAYAWYDEKFKKLLEEKVPYSQEAMAYILPYLPEKSSIFGSGKEKSQDISSVVPASQATSKIVPVLEPQKPEVPVEETTAQRKAREKEEMMRRLKEKEREDASENAVEQGLRICPHCEQQNKVVKALEVVVESLLENIAKKNHVTQDLQGKLLPALQSYTEKLKKAMDDGTEISSKDAQWREMSDAGHKKNKLERELETMLSDVRNDMDSLRKAIDEGKKNKVTKNNVILSSAQKSLNQESNTLNKSTREVSKAQAEVRITLHNRDVLDRSLKEFKKERESIVPDLAAGDRTGKKMIESDLNSLVVYQHRKIEHLVKEKAEFISRAEQRTEQALEKQQEEDEKLTLERLEQERERLRGEFELQKQTWDADAAVNFEQELRQQMRQLTGAHSDHLQEVLSTQSKEFESTFQKRLQAHLLEQREGFKTEMAGWTARLGGIETALDARAEMEQVARSAQELWLACVALNGALMQGHEGATTWEGQLRPLAKEIQAVLQVSAHHPFVERLVRSLSSEVADRGVWVEESLRDRFSRVKFVCKRVAMIDENGGSLFKYFISYLQSMFVFNSVYAKSSDAEIDLSDLDTFAILTHAEHWLERGDLLQALRFMNQLQGEPRHVASDWIKETRLFLETSQAIQALMAFASASGLGTIF